MVRNPIRFGCGGNINNKIKDNKLKIENIIIIYNEGSKSIITNIIYSKIAYN